MNLELLISTMKVSLNMQKLNKGEWSEAYCLLKTMADKKLFLCDLNLENTGTAVEVIGGRLSKNIEYKIVGESVSFFSNENCKEIPISNVKNIVKYFLEEIKEKQTKTFPIKLVEDFFLDIGSPSVKAKASNKADSILYTNDELTKATEKLSFSIKSFLVADPTLVNAGRTTNFTYKVLCHIEPYKNLKAKTLVKKLIEDKVVLDFEKMDSEIYAKNLMLVDTQMPQIISEMLKVYYSSKTKYVSHLVDEVEKLNPLNLSDTSIYKNKICDYLFYSATGMFPNTEWAGIQDIDGGCMIVKEDGEISTFYIFRKAFLEFFREYLYNKCFLDTASTTRHQFGRLYEEEGQVRLKLNLQVRIAK